MPKWRSATFNPMDHFIPLTIDAANKPIKVKCKYCDYQLHCYNATRMKEHFKASHDAPDHLHQSTIAMFGDKAFGLVQQSKAHRLLALFQVENAISFNSLESPSFIKFCQSIRRDFHVPSRRTIQRTVHDLHRELGVKVETYLKSIGFAHLQVDGWEDHNKLEVIEVTAKALDPES